MTSISLHEGDNRVTLRRMIDAGVRVHSVVTDPPYGLVSIQKRFGKDSAKAARTNNNDGSFARLSAGFMGQAWDGTGIERDPEFWALIYEILLPGGYVFAFSGSRTGHWQACAMEMAGFIMHPMHGWVFGSGFPKAHNASKAIDKHLGVNGGFEPAGSPVKRMIPGADQTATGSWEKNSGLEYQPGSYVSGSEAAAEWDGWAYGTQTQKPALEPIYLGQKPFDCKTGAANLLKHGVGALNIDGCRVPSGGESLAGGVKPGAAHEGWTRPFMEDPESVARWSEEKKAAQAHAGEMVRHPANLILDGSPEVVAMFPDSKGQQGVVKGTEPTANGFSGAVKFSGMLGRVASNEPRGDSGSAARFFHHFPPDADPLFYHSKAGKADRAGSKHPTVKPIALMQYLVRHITPPGGVVLDPFAGSGTTAEAARREGFDCILMEAHEPYLEFLRDRFSLPDPDILIELQHDSSPIISQPEIVSSKVTSLDVSSTDPQCSHFVLIDAPVVDDELLV